MRRKTEAGDWVLISERAIVGLQNKVGKDPGPGPHKVWQNTFYQGVNVVRFRTYVSDDLVTWTIPEEFCTPVRPPKPSLAELEEKARAHDPWRKIRDQMLSEVFCPEERRPKKIIFDWPQ